MIGLHCLFIVSLIFQKRGIIRQFDNVETSANLIPDRRNFLLHSTLSIPALMRMNIMTASISLVPTSSAWADTDGSLTENVDGSFKPYAPISALLPATRARLWIEEAYAISKILTDATSAANGQQQEEQIRILEKLNDVLTHRPKLFVLKGEKPLPRVSSNVLAQFSSNKQLSSSGPVGDQSNNDPFLESSKSISTQISNILNRADNARQWNILQYQESKSEQENELRAAFNYYTQQIEFDTNSYVWTASPEEKKRRIRNDDIPTPQAVIVSDLDLRDLYRNQLLTALDDVTAEVSYQLKQKDAIDVTDTIDLMNQAYIACSKWFDMIDNQDIQEAEEIIRKEKEAGNS